MYGRGCDGTEDMRRGGEVGGNPKRSWRTVSEPESGAIGSDSYEEEGGGVEKTETRREKIRSYVKFSCRNNFPLFLWILSRWLAKDN